MNINIPCLTCHTYPCICQFNYTPIVIPYPDYILSAKINDLEQKVENLKIQLAVLENKFKKIIPKKFKL